jgi:hypothetical protein
LGSVQLKVAIEQSALGVGGASNLELGGEDRTTLFAVDKCKDDVNFGCAAFFKTEVAGKAFTELQWLPAMKNKLRTSYGVRKC